MNEHPPRATPLSRARTSLAVAVAAVAVVATVAAGALVTTLTAAVVGPVGPAHAGEEPVLVSRGKPALGLSREKDEFPAGNAVDGDPDTRWSSQFSDPQWLRIDLGASMTVNRVEIDWEVAHSTAYSIQTSADAETWQTHWAGAGDGGQDVITVQVRARYVRVHSTARNGTAGISIWEMRVYGQPAPKPTPTPSRKADAAPAVSPSASPAAPPAGSPTASAAPPAESAPRPTPSRSGPPGSVPYYVVRNGADGKPEKLNDIAGRFLGDRDRWPEIAELTEGHRQPDGRYLTDPRTLRACWVLKLPKDAVGTGVRFGPLPGYEPSEASSTPSPSPSPSASASAGPAGDVAGMDEVGSSGPVGPLWYGAGGTLVLAGLVWLAVWLARRRGRQEPFDDSLLRTDTSAAWTVDRSLRVLIAACERDGLEVPGITGVFIEGSSLRLRLTSPALPAPEPWAVSEDGQSWSAPLAKLQSVAASDGSTARFARLVNVGLSETGRVLVDFATARGVISLDGPTRARHEVLRRWLGELTGNPWSDDPRVVMVGNGLPQPEQVEHLAGIEQVLPELEVGEGGVLVLSQAPSAAQQDLLAARFTGREFSWVVIVLGSAPSARWRFTAGDDGWLRSGFLPDVRYDEQTAVRRGGD